jgi:hypothetical protein
VETESIQIIDVVPYVFIGQKIELKEENIVRTPSNATKLWDKLEWAIDFEPKQPYIPLPHVQSNAYISFEDGKYYINIGRENGGSDSIELDAVVTTDNGDVVYTQIFLHIVPQWPTSFDLDDIYSGFIPLPNVGGGQYVNIFIFIKYIPSADSTIIERNNEVIEALGLDTYGAELSVSPYSSIILLSFVDNESYLNSGLNLDLIRQYDGVSGVVVE